MNTAGTRQQLPENVGDTCDNECAPDGAGNTAGTTCSHPSRNHRPEGASGIMLCQATDRNPPPRVRVADQTATLPAARHWFVIAIDDEDGTYCAACGLPRANRRHAERVT